MKRRLCELLKLNVLTFRIVKIDYVKDMVELVLTYELAEAGNPLFAKMASQETPIAA